MAGFISRRVRSAAISKGVFGESRLWLAVAVFMGVRLVVRKLAGDGPELLFSEELGPNERLIIGPVTSE